MKIEYDKDADALYISLVEGKVEETVKVAEDVLVEVGEDGRAIGIEILWVSEKISADDIKRMEVTV
mgnify:CR=1 FL=1